MEKLKRFDLQNAEILDKKGMKEVTGGNSYLTCTADVDCFGGACINGLCVTAREACIGKNDGDYCESGPENTPGRCRYGAMGAGLICWRN